MSALSEAIDRNRRKILTRDKKMAVDLLRAYEAAYSDITTRLR